MYIYISDWYGSLQGAFFPSVSLLSNVEFCHPQTYPPAELRNVYSRSPLVGWKHFVHVPSWELTYPLPFGTVIEDDVCLHQVRYVSFAGGYPQITPKKSTGYVKINLMKLLFCEVFVCSGEDFHPGETKKSKRTIDITVTTGCLKQVLLEDLQLVLQWMHVRKLRNVMQPRKLNCWNLRIYGPPFGKGKTSEPSNIIFRFYNC